MDSSVPRKKGERSAPVTSAMADYGEDYDVPLEQKKPFGAGIKRKRIEFVKAADPELQTTTLQTKSGPDSGASVADLYMSLVLPDDKKTKKAKTKDQGEQTTCAVCGLHLKEDDVVDALAPGDGENADRVPGDGQQDRATASKRKHEASIAHQVCLSHSHPPSALDRKRMGLAYLSSHGWDPDSRRGLGVEEQGMQYPLKTKPKDDTFGLGMEVPEDVRERIEMKKREKEEKERERQKRKPVDKKKAKVRVEEEKRKEERMREMFYGSEDLQRYLGRG